MAEKSVVEKVEANNNKDTSEALGQKYKDAVHAGNATLYNEKTAKAGDRAIDALAHGDAKGYVNGTVEVFKDASEALGQDAHDAARKIKEMLGGAREMTGAPHEVAKSSTGVKSASAEVLKL